MSEFVLAPGLLKSKPLIVHGNSEGLLADVLDVLGHLFPKGPVEGEMAIDYPSMRDNPDAIHMPMPIDVPWGWLRGTKEMREVGIKRWRKDMAGMINRLYMSGQHPHLAPDIPLLNAYAQSSLPKITLVLEGLADDLSRATLAAILENNFHSLVPIYEKRVYKAVQYFDGLDITPEDRALNIGIHNGWDLPYWLCQTENLISVDPIHPEYLTTYAKEFACEKGGDIHIVALDSYTGHCMLPFTDDGQAVGVHNLQTMKFESKVFPCMSLDDFVEKHGDFSIIKSDTEGAEQQILWGGMRSLQRMRPVLALSIYHSFADFIDIPLWCIRHLEGYKFFVRSYSLTGVETILYAIPEERNVPEGLR